MTHEHEAFKIIHRLRNYLRIILNIFIALFIEVTQGTALHVQV